MRLALAIIVLGACYRPADPACSVRRSPAGLCPTGLDCHDGYCKASADEACASDDAAIPTIDAAPNCFGRSGPGYLVVCPPQFVPTGEFDTSSEICTDVIQQPNGPEVCVILAETIVVTGTLTTAGARPLALVGAVFIKTPVVPADVSRFNPAPMP